MLTPGSGVLVDVHAAGVSFPELLQTRGEYQIKPPLPFVPGSEVGGIVREAPAEAAVKPGDRVAAFCMLGGFAEVAVAPDLLHLQAPRRARASPRAPAWCSTTTPPTSRWSRAAGCAEGETVLVHGAAGGVGTATLQVAKGLGATHDRRRLHRREGGGGPRGRSRPRRALRRGLEGRGDGDLRRRGRHRDRSGRRRPLHRQPARAARGRPRRGRRLHRRLDPRGQGQPAAAQEHRGDRGRVGRLRALQARR